MPHKSPWWSPASSSMYIFFNSKYFYGLADSHHGVSSFPDLSCHELSNYP